MHIQFTRTASAISMERNSCRRGPLMQPGGCLQQLCRASASFASSRAPTAVHSSPSLRNRSPLTEPYAFDAGAGRAASARSKHARALHEAQAQDSVVPQAGVQGPRQTLPGLGPDQAAWEAGEMQAQCVAVCSRCLNTQLCQA